MLVLFNTFPPLPGYGITEQIYLGIKTLVCRGIREKDQKPIIIKLMQNEYPTFSEIIQFRNQYIITKNLDLTGIVKPYSLVNYRNGYALLMEDFGGISLKDWGLGKKNLPITNFLSQFLHIAIQIASTLGELHRHRVIHKDIKPANILVNPSTLEVRLIDFSIASLLPREIQFLTSPNVLEGTLAYISPEQTGRMNRGIDYRSDFYSLGITFFELLTGQLPFTTTDPMELIYCHIAKQPPNASSINPNIPTVVCDIISKLMAKNAEDRYQSALGLKHDLEVCTQQWQETRKIAPFELGKQDISDRFLIPEKLYGRKSEVETLLTAFDRVTPGTTEMISVVGASGIGKTAVVNEVYKPIVRQRSYFIKGKFDQLGRDIPLSGFVQAFGDLIEQLLSETDDQIQQWKAKILLALGEQAHIIVDLIPKLELIIGKQPLVAELSGSAAQNRFHLLFQRFVQVFATKEHPLVIFLDDLQWADAASLKFIQLLMSESNAVNKNISSSPLLGETEKGGETRGGFLLIGAHRDNEVSKAHPLYLTLNEIEKTGVINTITLEPLNQGDLNRLIADTLHCLESVAVPLTQMVFAKTKGNPFFTHQFLKYLHNEEIIKFNCDPGHWQCDIAKVKALALTDNVVEFMAIQLEKLPIHTQFVLKLAACIGNQFDLKTLAIVYQKSEVDTAADLCTALVEGLVLPEFEVYKLFQAGNESLVMSNEKSIQLPITNHQLPKYKFVHDRVQQAAYSLITESQKQTIHLKIGQRLLRNTPVEEREEKIFEIVNHFNMALELITNQTERDELARMNLIAGRRAKASTAYAAAVKYLTTGIQLLADDSWEMKYDLTLALYETVAEAAYLTGDFKQMEQFVEVVLGRAQTILDKVKVYEFRIQAYTSQNKLLTAIAIARQALKQFGVTFPEKPSEFNIQKQLQETAALVSGKTIEELLNLPLMTSANQLAIMRIISSMIPPAYIADTLLFPLIILLQVNLSVQYGNAPLSAFCYACYGIVLNGILNNIEAADQFGRLALNLVSKFNSKDIKSRTLYVIGAFIIHGKSHIKETLPVLLEGYQTSLETGNLEFVGYCTKDICQNSYFMGRELQTLEQEIKAYSHVLEKFKQTTTLNYCKICLQTVINLLGKTENPCILLVEAYNEEKLQALLLAANDLTGIYHFYLHKFILCYLCKNFSQAKENAAKAKQYLAGGTGFITVPIFYFYDSLTALAVYPEAQYEQDNLLKQVRDNQVKLHKWAHHAPMNYLHKFYLVEAEQHRVLSQYLEAMDCYDRAITLAKEHEYVNEEALANELAAKFYLEWGKQKIAQTYLTDAYYGYVHWGALAKVDELAKCYPQLLSPILQQEKLSLHKSDKSTYSHSTSPSNLSNRQTVIGSKTSISDSLDLAAVIKGSQALSGQIELELLLSTLMEVMMKNAGASKCALILSEGDNLKLTVRAVSSNSSSATISTKLPSIRLESSSDVPVTLINYVKRTKEILVIDDATAVTFIADDSYIVLQQPKSLFCIPIINQSKLIGILYLENNLATGAFTRDRVEVLLLLITQAAICLENAMLYNNLEEKVIERTQELNEKKESLQQALQDLQSTQIQLIQSEKMSSLGQMVAGVAHEINNPINFIDANITYASQYVHDLLDLMAVYEQEYPNPSPIVQKKAKEIELDFLVKDLSKLLHSMRVGSSRIQDIVLGLRNFSRLDEAEMKPVDIHEGIDNTLMILQHKLKAQSDLPEIEVIKEYGHLPQVTCYASQLNQVFMNILSNAIDALQDGHGSWVMGHAQESSNHQLPISNYQLPTIRICTELTDKHTVKIRIADNGPGITSEVQQKIFDPFFTTKPVGSGTGLGLSISYQIVVGKHQGQLICNSTSGKGTEFVIEIPLKKAEVRRQLC